MGVPIISCKVCGINATHGSTHHDEYIKNPTSFKLADTHPFRVAQVRLAAAQGGTVSDKVVVPPPGSASLCSSVGGASWLSKDVLESRLLAVERNSTDANAATLCSFFRELLKE